MNLYFKKKEKRKKTCPEFTSRRKEIGSRILFSFLSPTFRCGISLCSIFLFSTPFLFSQNNKINDDYTFLFELPQNVKQFTTDKLQNIYVLGEKNEIIKFTPEGKEQFLYPNTTIGEPDYLDATNPFNLLLYFSDFQNVVTLDRTLNLAGEINLQQLGFFRVNALGMAGDGNLWVYDEVEFRLKKIGQDGKVILQSGDLGLELQKSISPNFLLERNQQVFLNDPKLGVLVFDVFGRYLKTLPLLDLSEFQVVGDELVFMEKGQLQSFHLLALLQSPLRLPSSRIKEERVQSIETKARVEKDRLYILEQGRLKVYRF